MEGNKSFLCGVQQVGVGIEDAEQAYNWYIKAFGCDIKVVDDDGVAERMLPYTGGKPRGRRAILACNLKGGSGFEVWQPKDSPITKPSFPIKLGDLGISVCRLKTDDVSRAYGHLAAVDGARILSEIVSSPDGNRHFFVSDPYGNVFDIVSDSYVLFPLKDYPIGGVDGCCIGVTDMERSMKYYDSFYGYDTVIYDATGEFQDLVGTPGGNGRFRRVLLGRSKPFEGALSPIYGTSHIELLQALDRVPNKIFEGRLWGDPGFIQICFEVCYMDDFKAFLHEGGVEFVCDSGTDFKMDTTDGRFAYVEDPDGTLIELVETYRIPISKKPAIFLNFMKRNRRKPLPGLVLRALKFLRV